jgi:hypothetical protein
MSGQLPDLGSSTVPLPILLMTTYTVSRHDVLSTGWMIQSLRYSTPDRRNRIPEKPAYHPAGKRKNGIHKDFP